MNSYIVWSYRHLFAGNHGGSCLLKCTVWFLRKGIEEKAFCMSEGSKCSSHFHCCLLIIQMCCVVSSWLPMIPGSYSCSHIWLQTGHMLQIFELWKTHYFSAFNSFSMHVSCFQKLWFWLDLLLAGCKNCCSPYMEATDKSPYSLIVIFLIIFMAPNSFEEWSIDFRILYLQQYKIAFCCI